MTILDTMQSIYREAGEESDQAILAVWLEWLDDLSEVQVRVFNDISRDSLENILIERLAGLDGLDDLERLTIRGYIEGSGEPIEFKKVLRVLNKRLIPSEKVEYIKMMMERLPRWGFDGFLEIIKRHFGSKATHDSMFDKDNREALKEVLVGSMFSHDPNIQKYLETGEMQLSEDERKSLNNYLEKFGKCQYIECMLDSLKKLRKEDIKSKYEEVIRSYFLSEHSSKERKTEVRELEKEIIELLSSFEAVKSIVQFIEKEREKAGIKISSQDEVGMFIKEYREIEKRLQPPKPPSADTFFANISKVRSAAAFVLKVHKFLASSGSHISDLIKYLVETKPGHSEQYSDDLQLLQHVSDMALKSIDEISTSWTKRWSAFLQQEVPTPLHNLIGAALGKKNQNFYQLGFDELSTIVGSRKSEEESTRVAAEEAARVAATRVAAAAEAEARAAAEEASVGAEGTASVAAVTAERAGADARKKVDAAIVVEEAARVAVMEEDKRFAAEDAAKKSKTIQGDGSSQRSGEKQGKQHKKSFRDWIFFHRDARKSNPPTPPALKARVLRWQSGKNRNSSQNTSKASSAKAKATREPAAEAEAARVAVASASGANASGIYEIAKEATVAAKEEAARVAVTAETARVAAKEEAARAAETEETARVAAEEDARVGFVVKLNKEYMGFSRCSRQEKKLFLTDDGKLKDLEMVLKNLEDRYERKPKCFSRVWKSASVKVREGDTYDAAVKLRRAHVEPPVLVPVPESRGSESTTENKPS